MTSSFWSLFNTMEASKTSWKNLQKHVPYLSAEIIYPSDSPPPYTFGIPQSNEHKSRNKIYNFSPFCYSLYVYCIYCNITFLTLGLPARKQKLYNDVWIFTDFLKFTALRRSDRCLNITTFRSSQQYPKTTK
jgi:hypothetical protein